MIPLGVLASARVSTAPTPVVVQVKTGTNTVTLNTAPTAGNYLVVGMTNAVSSVASWTYTHGLALDASASSAGGWVAGMASGVVQSGASATVTVTGMNASYYPTITVWEVSGVSAVAHTATKTAASTNSLSLGPITAGAAAFAVFKTNATHGGVSASGMTTDYGTSRDGAFHAIGPALPFTTTISWANVRPDAVSVIGGYS